MEAAEGGSDSTEIEREARMGSSGLRRIRHCLGDGQGGRRFRRKWRGGRETRSKGCRSERQTKFKIQWRRGEGCPSRPFWPRASRQIIAGGQDGETMTWRP